MSEREQQIRERAYALWEQEGRPEGREGEHWERASHEIGSGEDDRSGGDGGVLNNRQETPTASVGSASGLHPSGTAPGGGPGAGMGSIGTGGGSTGGAGTGSVRRSGR